MKMKIPGYEETVNGVVSVTSVAASTGRTKLGGAGGLMESPVVVAATVFLKTVPPAPVPITRFEEDGRTRHGRRACS